MYCLTFMSYKYILNIKKYIAFNQRNLLYLEILDTYNINGANYVNCVNALITLIVLTTSNDIFEIISMLSKHERIEYAI